MGAITEFVVDDATLGWPESLGYAVLHGPDIAAAEPAAQCWPELPRCGTGRPQALGIGAPQPRFARRSPGRGLPQTDVHRCAVADGAHPLPAPDAGGWRDDEVSPQGRFYRWRADEGD